MKDLGYKRTPTDARLRIEMPDASLWDVPVQVVADSRDENYRDDQEDTIGFIRAGTLTEYEITHWAANTLNWSDVSHLAVRVRPPGKSVDYEEGWCNGEKTIVGKL